MTETEEFLNEQYHNILELAIRDNKIDECIYDELKALSVDTLDEQEGAYQRMISELEQKELHDRILKGAEMIEKEKDQVKKRQYMAVYEQLITKLEMLKSA